MNRFYFDSLAMTIFLNRFERGEQECDTNLNQNNPIGLCLVRMLSNELSSGNENSP